MGTGIRYCLAAVLVRHGAAVHGGFVRDSLVLGEPASDLDARVPAGFDWDAVKAEVRGESMGQDLGQLALCVMFIVGCDPARSSAFCFKSQC